VENEVNSASGALLTLPWDKDFAVLSTLELLMSPVHIKELFLVEVKELTLALPPILSLTIVRHK